jgi:hypothetical protein
MASWGRRESDGQACVPDSDEQFIVVVGAGVAIELIDESDSGFMV